jgi:hypothetical protein
MIKKLRNQPCTPKVGASPQVGARGSNKKYIKCSGLSRYPDYISKENSGKSYGTGRKVEVREASTVQSVL